MKLGGAVQGIVMSCDVITGWWTTLATRAVIFADKRLNFTSAYLV